MNLTPNVEGFGQDDQSWLASAHGTDNAKTITLDTSAFTAGTHYPNGYFPSGLPLGKITATGKYGPYNNASSDGTEVLAGFLVTAIAAPSVNTIDPQGAMLWHGAVVEAKLPVAVDSAGKTDVAGRISFF
ncbi:head decoration protein [Streptomyces sp. NPDC038707]|uniref:head decoration protein n=1 Tax=Streptomyces sp. NPDC038707 TaxID=3154329 RepID=UPI0033D4AB76